LYFLLTYFRNSTVLAETTETTLLGSYINDWLGHMAQIVISFQGTLDKFIGDEVMALFKYTVFCGDI
jgi:class 3 adenylate cyclase